MKLPIEFVNRMNEYFSSDSNVSSEGFWESFDSQAFRGIRLNSIKTDRSDFSKVVERMGLSEKKVPWCEGGFYVEDESMKTGRDPYYLAVSTIRQNHLLCFLHRCLEQNQEIMFWIYVLLPEEKHVG